MKINEHLFTIVKQEMEKSTYDDGSRRLGAIVVLGDTIIAKGSNTKKTHTLQKKYNIKRFPNTDSCKYPPYEHAELNALKRIRFLDPKALRKCELYVYRQYADGNPAMARPCPSCMAFIKKLGLRIIHYSTPDGWATERLYY